MVPELKAPASSRRETTHFLNLTPAKKRSNMLCKARVYSYSGMLQEIQPLIDNSILIHSCQNDMANPDILPRALGVKYCVSPTSVSMGRNGGK